GVGGGEGEGGGGGRGGGGDPRGGEVEPCQSVASPGTQWARLERSSADGPVRKHQEDGPGPAPRAQRRSADPPAGRVGPIHTKHRCGSLAPGPRDAASTRKAGGPPGQRRTGPSALRSVQGGAPPSRA